MSKRSDGPEFSKFIEWYENEKKSNGLVDIKFIISPEFIAAYQAGDEEDLELLFAELNKINELNARGEFLPMDEVF